MSALYITVQLCQVQCSRFMAAHTKLCCMSAGVAHVVASAHHEVPIYAQHGDVLRGRLPWTLTLYKAIAEHATVHCRGYCVHTLYPVGKMVTGSKTIF